METSALFRKLKAYLPDDRLSDIDDAYLFSKNAHLGQKRASGKPYIQHPIAVADILADWRADSPSIIAALLHDVVEDTSITTEQIESHFGDNIAQIVDGLSKIDRLQDIGKGIREAESFRKLLLAAASDWRVIFIKIADRLHNMRTLGAISSRTKRKLIAQETLEIYAPIASRIGIKTIEDELKNLAFRHIHPQRHRVLTKAVKSMTSQARQEIIDIEYFICEKMNAYNIDYTIKKRQKSIYSIHQKMEKRQLSFDEVDDLTGFRLIVKDKMDCYLTMGIMHELMVPMLSRFRDFIAIPKSNGYQSLHTGGITKSGLKIDIQIRTTNMDIIAENGLAAHWMYKATGKQNDSAVSDGSYPQAEALKRLSSLVKLHNENATAGEFMENVKIDLFPDEMYVLTPNAKIITLPRGSTALDMSYAIHTEVGNHADRAIINGKVLPVFYELKSGDQIKILTNQSTRPLPHWLKYVKTARARSSIRQALLQNGEKESGVVGKSLLISALNRANATISLDEINESNWHTLLAGNNMKSKEMLYQAIGIGKMLPDIAAHILLKKQIKQRSKKQGNQETTQAIPIVGAGNSSIEFPNCCYALPEEAIVGILKKDKGLMIHSSQCNKIIDSKKLSERWINVEWATAANKNLHRSAITIQCRNRRGLISDISHNISNLNINIVALDFDGGALEEALISLHIIIEVYDIHHLNDGITKLKLSPDVLQINREFKK